ncbi:MAG: DNA polymerase III subunit gamma/tau [Bacteroidales bacterium]|nr:DNA polymerase III subunit gamma/tau [Bacteroidales bacterium]
MESYVVSARKYRPATFDSVVGQSHITNTLKNAIKSGQLAQAFLFCGPRGVGKTTCARILAKAINCQNLSDTIEACNECESCKSFNDSTSMNIFELDAASNNSVDDIRRLVEQVRIPPQSGKYKVYIVDEVHMLSSQAFNAFLKTLEEPPSYAKFILATTEKHKIIPTILSRCQIFDFKRIKIEDISHHLEYVAKIENIPYEPEALHVIAQKADGGLRDALSMFDQLINFTGGNLTYANCIDNLNVLDYEYYFKLVDYFRAGDIGGALLLYQQVLDKGFDGQHFITGLSEHIRNLLVCLDPITQTLLDVSDTMRYRYVEQAVNCKLQLLVKLLDISSDFEYRYRDANNKRLFIEVALTKLASLSNAELQINQLVVQQPVVAKSQQQSNVQQPLAANVSQRPIQQQTAVPKQVATQPNLNAQAQSIQSVDNKPKPNVSVKMPLRPSTISINVSSPNVSELEKEKKNDGVDIIEVGVEDLWRKYMEISDNEALISAMDKAKLSLSNANSFVVELDNLYSESIINKSKLEILSYMRDKTGVRLLDFETIMIKQESDENKIHTPSEKIEYLIKKNPQIGVYKTIFSDIY